MADARTWVSLCAGLDASSCRAMTGHFAPVTRMGGKRSYADHVLDIIGWATWSSRPTRWLMVDADPAIQLFWHAAFEGWLPAVAKIIREAPLDGQELWEAWKVAPVPADPFVRLARWVVLQKGNFSGKPLTWREEHRDTGEKVAVERDWGGVAGWNDPGDAARAAGFPPRLQVASVADRVERFWDGVAGYRTPSTSESGNWSTAATVDRKKSADGVERFWSGVAGYATVSEHAKGIGFNDRIVKGAAADAVDTFPRISGASVALDLAVDLPDFAEGDWVTIDPPYDRTTGYKAGLSRERVVEIAELAHDAGCRVLVHEAEPVIAGGPWRHVELERRYGGEQRTWSKQRREVATINFEPLGQGSLWAGCGETGGDDAG